MGMIIKVCGITNVTDAQAAVEAGADMLGFILYPGSRRCVTPDQARQLLLELAAARAHVMTVGVFVNETPIAIRQALDYCGLDAAQLHGEEPPELLGLSDDQPAPLAGRAYKALRPASLDEAHAQAHRYALPIDRRAAGRLPALLLDAYDPQLRGGTGQTGDWRLAAALAQQYPLLLAGGLTPTNVAQAIVAVRPWGVDVASGVETAPGRKDPAALSAFIAAARQSSE